MSTDPTVVPSSSALAAAGPLAAFKRGSAAAGATSPAPAAPAAPDSPAVAAPTADASAAPPSSPPRGPQPGGQRKPRREKKHRDEDATVDAILAADREARGNRERQPHVAVPNRREKSAELDAEIAAALGDLSLDEVVSGQAAVLAANAERLPNESRHRSQVIDIHGDNVFFALGGKNQGVASLRSFVEPPEVGAVLDVVVTGYNREDNLYDLAIPGGAIVAGDWSEISEGSLVEATITAANTGGLECKVNSLRGFIPASQVALYRIENFGDFVGQKLVCVVTESNERRGNLVLSRRAVLEREKEESKKALLAELAPGQMRDGIVRRIQDFGAFVDLGGVDGLIHISQLSWERVKHPGEILQEGQKIRVRVERIDPDTGKIGLSLKNPEEHPWSGIEQKFPVGAVVRGPVSRLAQFGAFVKLAPGVEGLIHISELAHHKVYKVDNVVKEGEEVEVKILSVDADAQRIGLSLKATLAKPEKADAKPKAEEPADEPPRPLAVPARRGPLKGGAGKSTGGEQFGLKW
ncbi:MAG: S1 RNA-binding domain-containing protein [Pirellulaceae bacterium]|nr:S1 RNA-binding domain-containing protein [Pirellulaceae bacterium]